RLSDLPEPPVCRGSREVGFWPRRVLGDLLERPDQPHLALNRPVRKEERQEKQRDHRIDDQSARDEAAQARPRRGQYQPGEEAGEGEARQVRLIPGRQRLKQERAAGEPQISPAPAEARGAMEAEEQEREPLVTQHLNVAELAEPKGGE